MFSRSPDDFQDPYSSLNPSKTIGWLLMEPLRAAGILDKKYAMSKADRKAAAYDMLARVGMDEKYFHRLPSELSGGTETEDQYRTGAYHKSGVYHCR